LPVQVTSGEVITFTAISSGNITLWQWDFGDGNKAQRTTQSKPQNMQSTHTYAAAGTYTISLKVSGPEGEDTIEKSNLITVTKSGFSVTNLPWTYLGIICVIALSLFWSYVNGSNPRSALNIYQAEQGMIYQKQHKIITLLLFLFAAYFFLFGCTPKQQQPTCNHRISAPEAFTSLRKIEITLILLLLMSHT
jgi:PKD repeat protein